MRNRRQQQRLNLLGHAKRLQLRGIAEQCQVAFIGIQGMGLRMRRQQRRLLHISLAQGGIDGLIEGEVGQAVVHQVDGQFAMPKHPVAQAQFAGVGDHRLQTLALEQLLEQQELRVEVLLLRRLVDDGDAAQRPFMARQCPLLLEHRDDPRLEGFGAHRRRQQLFDGRTTGALRPRQHRVEHRPTGIAVDLDQTESALGDVEVIPEEHPLGAARILPGDGRRTGQNQLAIGRQGHHRFDRTYHLSHPLQMRRSNEYRMGGEQIGATLLDQFEQAGLAEG